MNVNKLHIDQEPITVDTRLTRKKVAKGVGAVVAIAAIGVSAGIVRGEINQAAQKTSELTVATVPQNGTFSEVVEDRCEVSPTDLPAVMANVETNGYNNEIANAHGQVSPGEKVYFDANDCDPNSR